MSIANRATITVGPEVDNTRVFTVQAQTINRRNIGRRSVLQVFLTDVNGVVITQDFNVTDGGAGQILENTAAATRFLTNDDGLLEVAMEDFNDANIDAILNVVLPNGTLVTSAITAFDPTPVIPVIDDIMATGQAGDIEIQGSLFVDIQTVELYDGTDTLLLTFAFDGYVGADPTAAFRITDVALEDVTIERMVLKNIGGDVLYDEGGWGVYVPDQAVIDVTYDNGLDILTITATSGDSLVFVTNVLAEDGISTTGIPDEQFTSAIGNVIVIEDASVKFAMDPATFTEVELRRTTDFYSATIGTWTP